MRYWLVMPAAGTGRRFGDRMPKQYAPLSGRTVLEWALAPFLSDARCAGAVVVIAATDTWWPKIAERISPVTVVQGGGERCESVRCGLQALTRKAAADDWVLVHDAARPCLSNADRDRLLEQAGAHAVGGLLAMPRVRHPQAGAERRIGRDHCGSRGPLAGQHAADVPLCPPARGAGVAP